MDASQRFRVVEELFHELAGLTQEERTRRLSLLARTDPGLHAELLPLLRSSGRTEADDRALAALAASATAMTGTAAMPPAIGAYRIVRLIGEGGMGRVYEAEQTEPVQRRVALKLARSGFVSASALVRFQAERQALAVLDHPGIAKVFDAGSTDGGQPWFAMEYVDGPGIDEWARRRGLDLRERLALFIRVCQAVQHAHQKGLIHRDLKPSNILVVDEDGIGRPRVIDFGIVKVLDAVTDAPDLATRAGDIVGTPEYMSPEQATLGEIDVDTRSDVYSLGVVLYELLGDRLPFEGGRGRASFGEMCRRVREDAIPRLDRDATGAPVSGEINQILAKALAKDREQRYDSAAALADDLQRYLDDRPVQAVPPGFRYQAGKFLRRNRAAVLVAGVVAVALVLATVVASIGQIQARRAEQQALASAAEAEQARQAAESSLARAQFFLGRANLYHTAQNAYSDALQRLFGGEDDVERLTRVLLDRWQEAHARRHQEPESAALLSYAIGRHFLFRNDYPVALSVLEPWLAERYGPPELAELGDMLLPSVYLNLGRVEDAIPILRRATARLAVGFDGNSPEHVAMATQLASITAEQADIAEAERVLAMAAREDDSAQLRMYFANQKSLMRRLSGDLEGAHLAARDVVAVIDEHALMDISGTDTGLLNLAGFEYYHAGDEAAALALVDRVLGSQRDARGDSRESGRALELKGVIAAGRGDTDQAIALLESAVASVSRFSGERSQTTAFALAALAEAYTVAGRLELAQQTLDRLDNQLPEQDRQGVARARRDLAAAWLALHRDDAAGRADWPSRLAAHDEAVRRNPTLSHRRNALQAHPAWPGDQRSHGTTATSPRAGVEPAAAAATSSRPLGPA